MQIPVTRAILIIKQTEYMGKEYDYVFDVDIAEAAPPLKLPYNLSQNPYEAATKFIQDNELPITYLDQVANFITTNTQGATIGQSQGQGASAPGSDPWGSDNRYRPGGDSTPVPRPAPPKSLPQKEYLSILVARAQPMEKKIRELNQTLILTGHKDVSLNPTELTVLANLRKHIEASGATKTSQSVAGGLDLAIKLSTVWPYKDRLPGLDLLRLLAVAPMTAAYSHPRGLNIIDVLEQGATEEKPPAENHVMMAVRAFANLFDSIEGRVLAAKEFDRIQNVISTAIAGSTNRNLLVAATTVYINYSVYFKSETTSTSFEHVLAVLDTLGKILSLQNDSEVIFRALVATGTLLTMDEEVRSAAKDVYDISKSIATAVNKASDPRNRNAATEIKEILKA
jgi:phospholipase A-2-activating protein